jgi:hypothetical protein
MGNFRIEGLTLTNLSVAAGPRFDQCCAPARGSSAIAHGERVYPALSVWKRPGRPPVDPTQRQRCAMLLQVQTVSRRSLDFALNAQVRNTDQLSCGSFRRPSFHIVSCLHPDPDDRRLGMSGAKFNHG